MMRVARSGELTQLWLSSWRSRLIGYGVHVFFWRGVLIDTGFPAVATELRRAVRDLRPRGAIVTHGHEDHAGNLDVVARAGLPVWQPPGFDDVVRETEGMGLYRRVTWGRPRTTDVTVAPFDPSPLELLHTPGHSADHHVVWDPERDVLFSADLFLGVRVRVARPDENPCALLASLRQAAALRPRAMWDAHRGAIDDPVAALVAKADWLEELIARVSRRSEAGEPDERIAREELGRPGAVDVASFGDLSRVNLVRAIRGSATPAPGAAR